MSPVLPVDRYHWWVIITIRRTVGHLCRQCLITLHFYYILATWWRCGPEPIIICMQVPVGDQQQMMKNFGHHKASTCKVLMSVSFPVQFAEFEEHCNLWSVAHGCLRSKKTFQLIQFRIIIWYIYRPTAKSTSIMWLHRSNENTGKNNFGKPRLLLRKL